MIPLGVEICSPSFSSDFKKHENASLDGKGRLKENLRRDQRILARFRVGKLMSFPVSRSIARTAGFS